VQVVKVQALEVKVVQAQQPTRQEQEVQTGQRAL
jgi:hypothetical protein